MREVDRIADYIGLVFQARIDVDRRVGDDERRRMPGDVQEIGMADAALGSQARRSRNDSTHKFVGVQRSLHQQQCFARADQFDRTRRGGMAVGYIDQAEGTDILAGVLGSRTDATLGADQDRHDQAASAAAVAARIAAVVQGCAIAVGTGSTLLVISISRRKPS